MIGYMTAADVQSVEDLAFYTAQTLGTPTPTKKDINVLKKEAKAFFAVYPHATWGTLARVVHWAKAKRMRPAQTYYIVKYVRYAWQDGFLPELDPANRVDEDLESAIAAALEVEKDAQWKKRLRLAEGPKARQEVLDGWRQYRSEKED